MQIAETSSKRIARRPKRNGTEKAASAHCSSVSNLRVLAGIGNWPVVLFRDDNSTSEDDEVGEVREDDEIEEILSEPLPQGGSHAAVGAGAADGDGNGDGNGDSRWRREEKREGVV
ncbi:hypothetical protein RIF29_39060 [Crotalaria pallida]|uniref:Uncharacterized protein n=1 Tax=Crotalaria pallida TaxID=3830 RepID=A0AAN9E288_CROPI